MREIQETFIPKDQPRYRRYCLLCRIRYSTIDQAIKCPICKRTAVIDIDGRGMPQTYNWRGESQKLLVDGERRAHHA